MTPSAEHSSAADRWDRIEEDPYRLDIHGASFKAPPESIAPILIAALCALLLGVVSAFALPLMGFLPKASHNASAAPAPISLSDNASPQSQAPATEAQRKLRQTPVGIYNATDDKDRTTEFSGTLTQHGWIIGEMGVWSAEDPGRTTVYYGSSSTKDAAALLAADLNNAKIKYDSSVGKSVFVVISSGYQAG